MHSRRSCPQRWILAAFTCPPSPLRPPAITRSASLHGSCPRHIARTHPRPSLNLTPSGSAPSSSAPSVGRTATATTASTYKDASRVYRALFNHNLSSLRNHDLSNLLASTGQLQSGTKSVLTSRLSACFSSIMAQVNPNPLMKETASPPPPPPPPSPPPSIPTSPSTERIFTSSTPVPPFSYELPVLPIVLYDPQQRQTIQDKILPDSIISIDIGIRNLAWVELSKEGEILRWSVVDLLAPDDCGDASVDPVDILEESASTDSSTTADTQSMTGTTTPINTITTAAKGILAKKSHQQRKKSVPRVEPLPYDPQLVADRLDRVLSEILPESTTSRTPQKIVIERQRYRSAGMHEILDATIRCAVVEGMIHCWITAWNKRNGQFSRNKHNGQSSEGSLEDGLKNLSIEEETDRREYIFLEAVPPKAVAQWWGIGQAGASKASSPSKDAGEQDPLKQQSHIKYRKKKGQSTELVGRWLDNKDANLLTTPSGPSRLRVWCSSEMKEWFRQEKKKDDLSDCLLQAVAWYEWRARAIQEALDWSVAVPEEKKSRVKKASGKPRTCN